MGVDRMMQFHEVIMLSGSCDILFVHGGKGGTVSISHSYQGQGKDGLLRTSPLFFQRGSHKRNNHHYLFVRGRA
jgi:hypothetical protein